MTPFIHRLSQSINFLSPRSFCGTLLTEDPDRVVQTVDIKEVCRLDNVTWLYRESSWGVAAWFGLNQLPVLKDTVKAVGMKTMKR